MNREKKPGDQAADGLIPGIYAGLFLMGYLLVGGWISGLPAALAGSWLRISFTDSLWAD